MLIGALHQQVRIHITGVYQMHLRQQFFLFEPLVDVLGATWSAPTCRSNRLLGLRRFLLLW